MNVKIINYKMETIITLTAGEHHLIKNGKVHPTVLVTFLAQQHGLTEKDSAALIAKIQSSIGTNSYYDSSGNKNVAYEIDTTIDLTMAEYNMIRYQNVTRVVLIKFLSQQYLITFKNATAVIDSIQTETD